MGIRARIGALGARLTFADGALLIPLAALLAISTRIRGNSCGHDFSFHLISWMETQRSWAQGVLYPRWAQTPNWGAGEARFLFYPPLSWMLGALLGYLVQWDWVPMALIFLCLNACGLATRALARSFLPAPNATLAGILATAAPYALFTAYERNAFAELAAASLIPLLLLYALRPGSSAVPRPSSLAIPCSLVLATIWLTNAPAGVMATYLLAFVALVAALIHRQIWPILRAAIAAPLALGLAAFYLVPAAYEQRWIAIQQALDIGMRISDSWLFARHAAPDLEYHDQVLRLASTLLVFTASLALVGFVIALIRRRLTPSTRGFWLPLALLIPVIVLLQFPLSAPLWTLPKLQFLQFPWRWLMVLNTPFAIFLANATPLATRRARVLSGLTWTLLLLCSTATASLVFFQYCDQEDDPVNQAAIFRTGTGVEGTDEYAPLGSDNSLVASNLPDACLVSDPLQDLGESDPGSAPVWYPEQGSCDDTFHAQLWQNQHKLLQIDTDQAGYIVLRLRRYPAWRVTVNGQPANTPSNREDGLLVLPVPQGPSTVNVQWTTTPDVWWGRGISLASLVILLALSLRQRRLKAIRLS